LQHVDVDVSDLDSDIELDELIPTYLRLKGKLYEIDPSLVEAATRKQSKGGKSKNASANQPPQIPAVRKLLSQLQKITSDTLFDEYEAELQWPAKRNQIAQEKATKRLEQTVHAPNPNEEEAEAVTASEGPNMRKSATSTPVVGPGETEDETDLLGGMFSAVPDILEPGKAEDESTVSQNVTLRDFGKSSGLTPRRLLEEAVRSRFVDSE
jgi:ATP-dependent RNA helicase DHX29